MNGVEDHLRHAIRQMILAGNLPKENCRMTWYGPGTGGVCVACEQWIAAEEIEVECDLPKGGTTVSIGGAMTSGRRSGPRATGDDLVNHSSLGRNRAGSSY